MVLAFSKVYERNRIMEIGSDGSANRPVRLPLTRPFTSYFTTTVRTTTVRADSPPSRTLELLGPRSDASQTIAYTRVRLFAEP